MFLMLIVTTGTFRQPRTRPADKVNLIAPFAYRDPRGGTLAINALPSRVRSAETRRLHSGGGRRRIRLECDRCYHASAIRQSRAIGGKQPRQRALQESAPGDAVAELARRHRETSVPLIPIKKRPSPQKEDEGRINS